MARSSILQNYALSGLPPREQTVRSSQLYRRHHSGWSGPLRIPTATGKSLALSLTECSPRKETNLCFNHRERNTHQGETARCRTAPSRIPACDRSGRAKHFSRNTGLKACALGEWAFSPKTTIQTRQTQRAESPNARSTGLQPCETRNANSRPEECDHDVLPRRKSRINNQTQKGTQASIKPLTISCVVGLMTARCITSSMWHG